MIAETSGPTSPPVRLPRCRACKGDQFFWSRSKSFLEELVRTAVPVSFYRCHECSYRGPTMAVATWLEWFDRLRASPTSVLGFWVLVVLVAAALWMLLRSTDADDLPRRYKARPKYPTLSAPLIAGGALARGLLTTLGDGSPRD